ncbi:MAG TPA: hypothetical protein VFS15_26105 [Kofleriaceae bacterium]|nr:hypothetical protein [Kofleriaceae bacterium]
MVANKEDIMKLSTVIGLAAAGGFLYVHKQRGGELTLDSFADTARSLFDRARSNALEAKDRTEKKAVHEVATTLAEATETH